METKTETKVELAKTIEAEGKIGRVLLDKACDISAFASTAFTQHVLNNVHFRQSDCEASDGRMLIRVPYPGDGGSGTVDTLVAAKIVKDASRMAGKKEVLELNVNGKVALTAGGKTITEPLVDGKFPNVDQEIPNEEPKFSICLNARLLRTLADYADRNGTGKTCHSIRFDFTDNCSAVRFSIQLSPERKAIGVLMPVRMT